MHAELAARRVYVHPYRWTSLGLSLLEAMHLGMPVVALAATEAVEAVPREAGVLSTNPDELGAAVGRFGSRAGSVAPRTLRRALGWPLVGQDRCLVKRTDLAVHHDPATAVGRGPR